MIVCENCFLDSEIKLLIRNKGEIGDCPSCKSRSVFIYDSDKYNDLSEMLDELISIYTPISLLPKSYPESETSPLEDELVYKWRIFNETSGLDVHRILSEICKEKCEYEPELFDSPVGILEMYDDGYLSQHSLLSTYTWDDFVEALKIKNRFHTHYIVLGLFERLCSFIRKSYKAGDTFFRARLSTEKGVPFQEMSAPPTDKAMDGRANARGIRCLYLSDTTETTVFEVRAGVYDYITVGEFRLKKGAIVVDFKEINHLSPFIDGLDCLEYAINRVHLNKMNEEMGRIMRRSDSVLDYIPTQYIADFVKSITRDGQPEYAGIEYKSVMHNEGYNIAFFDPDLFECIDTKVYGIDSIDYSRHIVLDNSV